MRLSVAAVAAACLLATAALSGCSGPAKSTSSSAAGSTAGTASTASTAASSSATTAASSSSSSPVASGTPGPHFLPGYTWSEKLVSKDPSGSETAYRTLAILATGFNASSATWAVGAYAYSDKAAPAPPTSTTADNLVALQDGTLHQVEFDPSDYDCAHPDYCFHDPDFLARLAERDAQPPFPLHVGDTWSTHLEKGGATMDIAGRVVGPRSILVGAGTFDTVQLRLTETFTVAGESQTATVDEDYSPTAQGLVKTFAKLDGEDISATITLESLRLVPGAGEVLGTVGASSGGLSLTVNPAGPLNAADATVVHVAASAADALVQVRSGTGALVKEGPAPLDWTADHTGRYTVSAAAPSGGTATALVRVGLDLSAQQTCNISSSAGFKCTPVALPIGGGTGQVRIYANTTGALDPTFGGTLELLKPDGSTAASVTTATASASLTFDLHGLSGDYAVRWTPKVPQAEFANLHVVAVAE